MRGGMGRGGGGTPGGRSNEREAPPLRGPALFEVQSVVFGRYLSREGYDFIGALADGQIQGKTPDDVFKARNERSVDEMNRDWHQWLLDRAALLMR